MPAVIELYQNIKQWKANKCENRLTWFYLNANVHLKTIWAFVEDSKII